MQYCGVRSPSMTCCSDREAQKDWRRPGSQHLILLRPLIMWDDSGHGARAQSWFVGLEAVETVHEAPKSVHPIVMCTYKNTGHDEFPLVSTAWPFIIIQPVMMCM